MRREGGNDVYYVNQTADLVFEGANAGTDTVVSTVSYTLAANQQVEVLRLAASTGGTALNLTGNEFATTLNGMAGADTMRRAGGNDTYVVG